MITLHTAIDGHAQADSILPCPDVPTTRAPLRRGIPTIRDDDLAAIDRGLVEQHRPEHSRSHIQHCPRQPTILPHEVYLQVLDHNRLVLATEIGGYLKPVILPLILQHA